MSSYLKYNGSLTRYALKKEFAPGSTYPLSDFFSIFAKKSGSSTLDLNFITWFFDTQVKSLGEDFELVIDQSEFTEEIEKEQPVDEDTGVLSEIQNQDLASLLSQLVNEDTGKLLVESSDIEVANSLEESLDKLTHREQNTLDEITRVVVPSKSSPTKKDFIKSMPKPGEVVMTGDDLARDMVMVDNMGRVLGNKSSIAINEKGETIPLESKTKDQVNRDKMASLSNNIRVLQPDASTDSNSKILFGDKQQKTEAKLSNIVNSDKKRVNTPPTEKRNKHFQAHSNLQVAPDPTPESISDAFIAGNFSAGVELVNVCKNPTILKVARIKLLNLGLHRAVEKVDYKLRLLPRI